MTKRLYGVRLLNERALARLDAGGLLWAKISDLDPRSLRPVLDAVRCVYPYAAAVGEPGRPSALMGSLAPIPARVSGQASVPLPPADEACDPLTLEHPRRLRARRGGASSGDRPPTSR